MVLSLVITFTSTIREFVLLPLDSKRWEPYNPKIEDEILMPTLKFLAWEVLIYS